MSGGPLAGRRVLVTRPHGRGQGLSRRLEGLGASVELRPTIAFEPPRSPAAARQKLDRLHTFDWLVFTSPTGVRFFLEALGGVRREPPALAPRVAAIGEGTSRALGAAGVRVDLVAGRGSAEGLVESLLPHCRPGTRVLIVRPEVAREVLPAALADAGAVVEIAAVYRTVASREAPAVARAVAGGRYDAFVFTSPSTLVCLLEAAGEQRDRVVAGLRAGRRVAIGSVTAEALAREGLPADAVADSPDEQAIADAVERLLAR